MSTRSIATAIVALAFACAAQAQTKPAPAARTEAKPDPVAVLMAAKNASGGAAWDGMKTQRSEVTLATGNIIGTVERWSDIETGRSMLRYKVGPLAGAAGFDGKQVWTQEEGSDPKIETDPAALELATNAAYRDRLAFWYPERARARIEYKERAEADGRKYDVVTIVPEGGRSFDFWIDAENKLITRLVEREANVTRTEVYSDRRDVQGVKIPFHVETSRGDPKFDELVNVKSLAFNDSIASVAFGPPVVKAELVFPPGRASVEVPFEAMSGHLFVQVMFDGRGPFRMLLDAGGANVLSVQTATALLGSPPTQKTLTVASTTINGVELGNQRYAVADIDPFLRRVEGLSDVAGVLGLEWFVRMPVRIDYARSRITFFDPAQWKGGSGVKVPIAQRGRLPQVKGSLDGVEGLFEIDTGSRGSLTLTPGFVAKNDLAKKLAPKNTAITGSGMAGPVRASLARAKSLKLGTVDVPNPIVALPRVEGEAAKTDLAGNVGFALMRQFAVTYDLPNDTLYFERYLNFGAPDIADRGGLWLERTEEGFAVIDVVAGGPAAAAGLKAGDVIVEVNGYPSAQLLLPAVRELMRAPPGARVNFKTSAGKEATVVLRDLV
ncbi:MAG: retropepsin-like aspartic protease [Burkholderiales bacterium]